MSIVVTKIWEMIGSARWAIVAVFQREIDAMITRRLVKFATGLEADGVIPHVTPGWLAQDDKPLSDLPSRPVVPLELK
jgi:hypothetical protein